MPTTQEQSTAQERPITLKKPIPLDRPTLPQRRFTVDEYHAMIEAGILGEEDRIELLEGKIYAMAAVGSRHSACVDRLTLLLVRAASDRSIVRVQSSIRLGDSEPEPDVTLLKRKDDFYASALPEPADVLLLVEVADTSAGLDRRYKMPLYAKRGIREAWLVDLEAEAVEVYRQPLPDGYAQATRYVRGEDRYR